MPGRRRTNCGQKTCHTHTEKRARDRTEQDDKKKKKHVENVQLSMLQALTQLTMKQGAPQPQDRGQSYFPPRSDQRGRGRGRGMPRGRSSYHPRDLPPDNDTCFRCGQRGHWARHCSQRGPQRGVGRREHTNMRPEERPGNPFWD